MIRTTPNVPGYSFPYVLHLECPSEVCRNGRWLACRTTSVWSAPGARQLVGRISAGEYFQVVGTARLVRQAGIVRVTEDVRQPGRGTEDHYAVGDTLFVIGHLGEGWFAAVHNGRTVSVDVFWPDPIGGGWRPQGKVLREHQSEVWLQTSVNGRAGWARSDTASLVSGSIPSDPVPCRAPD